MLWKWLLESLNTSTNSYLPVCVCSACMYSIWLHGLSWRFYDDYQVWQLFVVTIFMLHNVFNIIYRRLQEGKKWDERRQKYLQYKWEHRTIWLMNGLIKISQQRFSALPAGTYVVIPSLHWDGRGGLGVNTYRGLSLSLSMQVRSSSSSRSTRHLWKARDHHPPHPPPFHSPALQLSFHRVRGSLFSHQGNCVSLHMGWMHYGLWMRHRGFQCAFHRVSALTEDQWIRNQHLYKMLFLALTQPPPPIPPPQTLTPTSPPPTAFLWS